MQISDELKDVLTELFNTGIGKAAASLCELLNTEVHIGVPRLEFLYQHELKENLLFTETEQHVAVTQQFSGGIQGKGLLSFPISNSKTLINLILDDISETSEANETLNVLELEAITEVGNMIINAICCTIADMLESEITCKLPNTVITSNLIDIIKTAGQNIYIIGLSYFGVKTKNISGNIIFIFAYANLENLLRNISEPD